MFTRILYAFTPVFLKKYYKTVSLWQALLQYFLVGLIITLLGGIITIIVGWFWLTPERMEGWVQDLPDFHFVFRDSQLVSTGLQDPFIYQNGDFTLFASSETEEVPEVYNNQEGIFILKNKTQSLQIQNGFKKQQIFYYREYPSFADLDMSRASLTATIFEITPRIKTIFIPIVWVVSCIIGLFVGIWYLLWSFFWALIIWWVSQATKVYPMNYEQSLIFVLSTIFFGILLMICVSLLGGNVPFIGSLVFMLIFLYNHLTKA